MNRDRGHGEAVRVPLAEKTLVTVPGSGHSDELLRPLLTLSDAFATGHHAAVWARVKAGHTVAVVGDGAVGLSGVLAAKRLGAERIIALSRHAHRQALAKELGAPDIVAERDEAAVARVKCARTCPSCSSTSSPGRSARGPSSTSRPTSTASARRTPRWTSARR
jgi:threonine dehydrogenase-like Zn-dependent dehydrogenase